MQRQFAKLFLNSLLFVLIALPGFLSADDSAIEIQIYSANGPTGSPELSESDILARAFLAEQSAELTFDTYGLHRVSLQISETLALIRSIDSSMSQITARPQYLPDRLIMGFEGELERIMTDALAGKSGTVGLKSGVIEFDELNRSLGLFAIESFPRLGSYFFHFREPVNLPVAIQYYSKIPGVNLAEPDEFLYVAPTTDVDVFREHETWHVVFTKPIGELFELSDGMEVSVFSVNEDQVERHELNAICGDVDQIIPCAAYGLVY